MNKFFTSVVVILLTATNISFAAKTKTIKGIPNRTVEAFLPDAVCHKMTMAGLSSLASDGYGQNNANGYWVAYCDSEGTATYYAQDGKEQYSTLSFGEQVIIAKIRKDKALAYAVSPSGFIAPEIPPAEFCRGWVPLSSLVVNRYSLASDIGNDIKVLFRNETDKGTGYNVASSMVGSTFHTLKMESMSVFYAVKINGDKILLSSEENISQESLLGWVNSSDVIVWDNRLSLEKTWNPVDIRELEKSGEEARIRSIGTDSLLVSWTFELSENNPFDSDGYRMSRNQWRLPVIKDNSQTFGIALPREMSSDEILSMTSMDQGSHNANIFLILDGSRRYEDCFLVISESLAEISMRTGYNVRIGAIIYHDSRQVNNMTEFHQLSDVSDNSLYSFIDNGGATYGFKDNLTNAPLCQAISQAIDFADFSPEEANYIIVVGGRGDDSDSETDPYSLAERLGQKNISLYGIQVRNENNVSSYRNFRYILEDIMMSKGILSDGFDICKKNDSFGTGIQYTSFLLKNAKTEEFDGLSYIDSGIMDEDVFKNCYFEVIDKIGRDILLKSAPNGLPQMFRFAVANKEVAGKEIFKKSVLYSSEELQSIINMYQELSSHKKDLDRKAITDILKQYVETNPLSSGYDYMNIGYRDVMRFIEGFRLKDIKYSGAKLKDIASKNTVHDEELEFILDEISSKLVLLELVKQTPAVYGMMINGADYFWVPTDYLI